MIIFQTKVDIRAISVETEFLPGEKRSKRERDREGAGQGLKGKKPKLWIRNLVNVGFFKWFTLNIQWLKMNPKKGLIVTIYCQHWESNIFLWTKNGSYWTNNKEFLFWDLNMYIFAGFLKIVCIVNIVSIVDVIFLWYTQMAIRFLSKPKYCKNDFIFGVQGVPKRGDRDAVPSLEISAT